MRFHALLPVRDEADIVDQCLAHLLNWADSIYVFDTGSIDETWEIVQDFATKDCRVKPLRKDHVFFSETRLRGWMFHQARQHMRDGDWFLRVDADEFHHITPPEFVKTRMRKHETIAYHQYYNFCLLESEVADWEAGRVTLADRARPIHERRRWYIPSVYSEPRLCRYRGTMQWPPSVSFPFNAGFVARERLSIRHYPHRDPLQLERRCRLRAVMMADAENRTNWSQPELHHWAQREWRRFVVPDSCPDLRYWTSGMELPEVRSTNHLAKPHVRLLQWTAHRFLLPMLDRTRRAWPSAAYPQLISNETVVSLKHTLSGARSSEERPVTSSNGVRTSDHARFHAMLCVRGEADIISQCLAHLLEWADSIYVFDTGSVDGTWEILQDAAAKDARIRPLRKDTVYFSQKLVRGWLFNQARQQMREGDWFLRVDADEFYHIPPPEFVKTRMRKHESIVFHQYFNFCLLESEVAAWEAGLETLADRARPIHERRRWYIHSIYSEPRMCRYRGTMQWPPTVSFPFNAGFVARERLPVRHYPYRDPAQLARRCRLRAAMMADGTRAHSHHWAATDWRTLVTPDSTPELKYWAHGDELPELHFTNHLSKPYIRLVKRVAHGYLLPVLDSLRPGWPEYAYPERIPADEVVRLEQEMSEFDQ